MPKYAELQALKDQNLKAPPNGRILLKEARAVAIRRIEESARTEDDFKNVLQWWDRLDSNRERRERSHEIGRSDVPLEWRASQMRLPPDASYDMVLRGQLLAGDFIDYIFDHPETLHELVADCDLSGILRRLKPHQKQMAYYLFIRRLSASEYAGCTGQTDRNVRGIRETALNKLRKEYTATLKRRQEGGLPLTLDEKYFLEHGTRGKKE